jgi:glucokinase
VLDEHGTFLIDRMIESPSRVGDGPDGALEAISEVLGLVLDAAGVSADSVRAVGLDTPGPASATGVISARGATNFSQPEWWGFDFRSAVEHHLALPVIYNNDGNAAALYAHDQLFGGVAHLRSSVSAIVGTGLGGGVVESGRVIRGASGMAGELGHVHIPMDGLLGEGQPVPTCNCGFVGDAESVASLSGLERNLLPYWLERYPDHPVASLPIRDAARQIRSYGERGDEMALLIFGQQAHAIGRLFTIAANFTDPDAYFIGGGVIEAEPHFRTWFLDAVRGATSLRVEQIEATRFALVSDLDMAGARGSALAALHAIRP